MVYRPAHDDRRLPRSVPRRSRTRPEVGRPGPDPCRDRGGGRAADPALLAGRHGGRDQVRRQPRHPGGSRGRGPDPAATGGRLSRRPDRGRRGGFGKRRARLGRGLVLADRSAGRHARLRARRRGLHRQHRPDARRLSGRGRGDGAGDLDQLAHRQARGRRLPASVRRPAGRRGPCRRGLASHPRARSPAGRSCPAEPQHHGRRGGAPGRPARLHPLAGHRFLAEVLSDRRGAVRRLSPHRPDLGMGHGGGTGGSGGGRRPASWPTTASA